MMATFVDHLNKRPPAMQWTDHQDLLLCKEILSEEPYRYKPGTRERGHSWSRIADNLNAMRDMNFNVSKRSVRDRYNLLEAKHIRRVTSEEKGTEVARNDPLEFDSTLEEIIKLMKEGDHHFGKGTPEGREKDEWDEHSFDESRRYSIDTLPGVRKRKAEGSLRYENGGGAAFVRAENETLIYIREKMEQDASIRQQELELKRQEMETHAKLSQQQTEQQKLIIQGQTAIIQSLQQQLQKQQEQQQKQQQQLYEMQFSFLDLQLKQARMQQQLMTAMMNFMGNLNKDQPNEEE